MKTVPNCDIASAADRFAAVARRYCDWAESASSEPEQDLVVARGLLAELHVEVLRLPENCPTSQESEDRIDADAWKERHARFEALPIHGYWSVFDPLVREEPVFNTLSDDLADIWRDVKEGLVMYESGDSDGAIWEWRFNYGIHWGRHLLGALYAIHSYFS